MLNGCGVLGWFDHVLLCVFTGSPFSVPVHDTVDATKVKCLGQGLGNNVRANIPQVFTVDASKAGVAPLQVRVQGPKGKRAVQELAGVLRF